VIVALEGERVVVVGGSSGIGLETARLALAAGASVTIAGRSEDRLRRAAADLGGAVRSVVADVTDDGSVKALFDGETRVDHVFLPAGELKPGGGDVLGADLSALRSILESRLLGVVHVVRRARPKMAGGSITLMSGLYANRPGPGTALGAAAVVQKPLGRQELYDVLDAAATTT